MKWFSEVVKFSSWNLAFGLSYQTCIDMHWAMEKKVKEKLTIYSFEFVSPLTFIYTITIFNLDVCYMWDSEEKIEIYKLSLLFQLIAIQAFRLHIIELPARGKYLYIDLKFQFILLFI